MSTATDIEPFKGTNSKKCEDFVEAINTFVFQEGKQRDDEWIADLAAARLRGRALRWHTEQDEATQRSWRLLKKALFERWPQESDSEQEWNTATIPRPAAAARPPVSRTASNPSLHAPEFLSISTNLPAAASGILQIQDADSGDVLGYLGKKTSSNAPLILRVTNRSDAVTIQLTQKHEIVLLNMEWQSEVPSVLALTREQPRSAMEDGIGWYDIPFTSSLVIIAPRDDRPLSSAIWEPAKGSKNIWFRNVDNAISILPTTAEGPTEVWACTEGFGLLRTVRDPTGKRKWNGPKSKPDGFHMVKLVFEPSAT